MKTVSLCILTLGMVLVATPACRGQLVLQIDAANKTFAFVGQDTGKPDPVRRGGGGLTSWNLGVSEPIDPMSDLSLDNGLTFSASKGTAGNPTTGYDFLLDFGSSGITFTFGTSNSGNNQVYTGLGNFQSYASLSADNQIAFESSIGSSFSLVSGSNYGSVLVSAVPEPTSALLFGLAAGSALLIRRRRQG